MLKKIKVTMPFHEVVIQIMSYTKFLKDILTKKRAVEKETVALSTEVSAAILQTELPQKMADPGSFSIPCKMGIVEIERKMPLKVGEFYIPVDFVVLNTADVVVHIKEG
ncbi:PREDICTED: uncharacterized protein LOC104822539 [Tarenaya hassleriana]|uniref:uncharacterized protein LOC104822539 n=1 Tax=Tarenaya hassleriana TaxID=28532 RepID=UPI00053C9038|nr:PREDICTED: uncharacterized protein LOC104822539 [Tarenaya hassleriana]